jgi:hypothetical protein
MKARAGVEEAILSLSSTVLPDEAEEHLLAALIDRHTDAERHRAVFVFRERASSGSRADLLAGHGARGRAARA